MNNDWIYVGVGVTQGLAMVIEVQEEEKKKIKE